MNELLIEKTKVNEMFDEDKYSITLHNDSHTPMDFVIMILQDVFEISETESLNITIFVHNNEEKIIGIYTMEDAYDKLDEVERLNNLYGESLLVTIQKV